MGARRRKSGRKRKKPIKVRRPGEFTKYMRERFGKKAFNTRGHLNLGLVEKVKDEALRRAKRARTKVEKAKWLRLARQAIFARVSRKWRR